MQKNYSYLAIQLQKLHSSAKLRQLRYAFQELCQKECHQELASESEPEVAPAPAPRVPRHSRSESWQLGLETLASVVALQLRHGLRRWETYARRRHFEARQAQVVHALRHVQAEMDGREVSQEEASPATPHFRDSPQRPDVVKALCEDQARIDEVIKLAGSLGLAREKSTLRSHMWPRDLKMMMISVTSARIPIR